MERGAAGFDAVVDGPLRGPHAVFRIRREPVWLPAGLLAALLLLTMTAGALGGEGSLQWRPAGPQASASASTPVSKRVAPNHGRVSRVRWVDPKLRRVAYDEPVTRFAQQGNGGPNFGDELLKEFSTPMGKELDAQPPKPFEELPPKAPPAAPDFDDLPEEQPPVIEPGEDASPAQPGFDPFDQREGDQREEPRVEALDPAPTPPRPSNGSGTRSRRTPPKPSPRTAEERKEDERRQKERAEAMEDCAENLAELRASNLSLVDITIGRSGVEGEDFPFVCSIDDGVPLAPRCWAPITYTWKASALCHKPLYFEQEQLERYGHSWGPVMQPIVSGAHFFGHLAVLPYSMGLKAPNECVYALGHYRPGNCAPYLIPAVPFTWRAAALQGGFATGAAFLIP